MRYITKTFILSLFIAIVMALTTNAQVKNIEVQLKGKAKEVNVTKDNAAIKFLAKHSFDENKPLIDTILKHPNDYNPTVLYVLSRVLFNNEQKDEASFWFYVAQLRSRYDFNRCNDQSCSGTVAQLTAIFGPDINQYAIPQTDFLEKTIDRVVDFVQNNKENYDQRWINLDGMAVMQTSLGGKNTPEMSKPEKDWPAIKSETIKTYYSDFKEYLASKKK